eukprot:gnl/MRDRNA2_/MRDRNA2_78590_c0_seq4.p1 gnl/MRDRNA2_/MRDRNA2_78590_c0~~gnl/MRDRNA2_/MRDRNA2_78590_c0_seq4.p1  ORF type:complete len:292 (+),score=50.07 gnl/MRDRNA2_/MRDRNA2_78590_c0_seq4:116-991(+)
MRALLALLAITPGLSQNASSFEPTKMVYGENCTEEESKECEGDAAQCFNHTSGACAENGTMVAAVCNTARVCAPCYPNSRCGGDVPPPATKPETFVPGGKCGNAFKACEKVGWCFRHDPDKPETCSEDGQIVNARCKNWGATACTVCFPNSRCGGLKKVDPDAPEAMIYGETCKEDSGLAKACSEPVDQCFSHTSGACNEDGTWAFKLCEQAVSCAPCYPNSRCGGMRDVTSTTATTTTTTKATQDEEAHRASANADKETASAEHMASSSSACMLFMLILQSGLHTWTFCM